MTNNLKAERTLTAEDGVSDERLADLLERDSYRMYQSVLPMELSSMLAELQSLRSNRVGPELWGRVPDTGIWERITDGSNTEEQVLDFERVYRAAGWTSLTRDNPFTYPMSQSLSTQQPMGEVAAYEVRRPSEPDEAHVQRNPLTDRQLSAGCYARPLYALPAHKPLQEEG